MEVYEPVARSVNVVVQRHVDTRVTHAAHIARQRSEARRRSLRNVHQHVGSLAAVVLYLQRELAPQFDVHADGQQTLLFPTEGGIARIGKPP